MTTASVNTQLLAPTTTIALSQNSDVAHLDRIQKVDVTATIADAPGTDATFDTGVMDIWTATCPTFAGAGDGDYCAFYDTSGNRWAFALDLTGLGANIPTGAIWTAIPAERKVSVDISLAVTATNVADAVEDALELLTDFSTLFALTSSSDTLPITAVIPGVVSAMVVKNKDDSGAGSITAAHTATGTASEVNPTANSVYMPSHGYTTGMKVSGLTSTGTLPAGLSNTTYYVIKVDADNIKFATSQANALAGTAVDITGYGTTGAVHTVDIAATIAATAKLQKTNSTPAEVTAGTAVWVDLDDTEIYNGANSQSISAAGNKNWLVDCVAARAMRVVVAVTSGGITADIRLNGKG